MLRQSVEVSGAFIRAEYRAQPLPLVLLWQGIAAFLGERPHYRYLIGSVRLHSTGSSLSPAHVLKVIKRHCYDAEVAAYVRVRKPFRYRPLPGLAPRAFPADVNSRAVFDPLLTSLQPGDMGLPKGLRPYFRRHLRFLGFHLSPTDSHCLNGVALLDVDALPECAQQLLAYYPADPLGDYKEG